MKTEIDQLAQYVCRLALDEVPEKVLSAAKYCILDNLGAALGAADSTELQNIARAYEQINMTAAGGLKACSWVLQKTVNVINALFLNGLIAHELELDDVHTSSKSHIGAVVVPTAWTLAEAFGCSGKQFLEAVIAGYEAASRIGMGMDIPSNRKRGWHVTGITGAFGSAAAAAKLMGLDAEQTANAFGLAGTQSAGLWAFLGEGASCKKLHTGRAAMNGFASALLAKAGMTGAKHILDAEDGGLYRAVSDSFDMARVTAGLGSIYEIMNVDKKPYPCCRTTHPGIDATLKLREQGLRAEDVDHILVETYATGVLQCGMEKYPETKVEAKFSIRYTCAAALVRGRLTQEEFSASVIENPEVRRIAAHTDVQPSEEYSARYPKRWGCKVTVWLRDGSCMECPVDDMSGSVIVPLTNKQEHDKFIGLACQGMTADSAEDLYRRIMAVEQCDALPELECCFSGRKS